MRATRLAVSLLALCATAMALNKKNQKERQAERSALTLNMLLDDESPAQSEVPGEVTNVQCRVRDKGQFIITVRRDWAPRGARRFLKLVEDGFFDGNSFYRAVEDFVVQFGLNGEKAKMDKWSARIKDDEPHPVTQKGFRRGMVSFAAHSNNSRSSYLFIATQHNEHLGKQDWERPIGYVSKGMSDVEDINVEYGDMPPYGNGPDPKLIRTLGHSYLYTHFPHLDYVDRCYVLVPGQAPPPELPRSEEENGYWSRMSAPQMKTPYPALTGLDAKQNMIRQVVSDAVYR